MADKMTKKGEKTQQVKNPVDEIIAMKAAADHRRQEIRKDIDSLTAELYEAEQMKMNANNTADFQAAYEKSQALNALIARKKAENESVRVDISEDSIVRAWNAFAVNYADDIKASLEAYKQEKRKLYEMLIAIAEKHNEILKVKSALENELYLITGDRFDSISALTDPAKVAEYDDNASTFFDDIIKAGDYLKYVINAITVWNRAADLDDPENKATYNNQRVFGF